LYPRILDINMNLVAVLNLAYKIGYTKIKNNLWTCQFTLPLNDKINDESINTLQIGELIISRLNIKTIIPVREDD